MNAPEIDNDVHGQIDCLPVGSKLNGSDYEYTIVKMLGQGQFGITYLATAKKIYAPQSGKFNVAVKEYFIKGVNGRQNQMVTCAAQGGMPEKYKGKFRSEADKLQQFDDSGIVKVYEAFEANNTYYYSMEYIGHGDLESFIAKNGPLPIATIKSFARQLAMALRNMHSKGMLHLDIKPANVMMRTEGDDLVLIDFGFSKCFDQDGKAITSSTLTGGTEFYRPFEQTYYRQSEYKSKIPTTLDVYALTATIYKMTTGRTPVSPDVFAENFPFALLESVGAPPELVVLLQKGLAQQARDRIQDMDEMLQYIDALPDIVNIEVLSDNVGPDTKTGIPADDSNHQRQAIEGELFQENSHKQIIKEEMSRENNLNYGQTDNGGGSGGVFKFILTMILVAGAAFSIVFFRSSIFGLFSGKQSHTSTGVVGVISAEVEDVPQPTEADVENFLCKYVGNNKIEGTFKYTGKISLPDSLPNGIGVGIYPEGRYEGMYVDGKREGQGNYSYKQGRNVFVGTFKNDEYFEGTLTTKDKLKYKGTFKNGMPYNGKWYDANSQIVATYINGNPEY